MVKRYFKSGILQKIVIFTAIAAILFVQSSGYSQTSANQKDEPKNAAVAFMFRMLAKGVIATTNAEVLKERIVDKISKMDEEKFRLFYLDFYEEVSGSEIFTAKYGFTEDMTKEQAIGMARSLDKSKLYDMIDSLPDQLIVSEFKRYISKNNKQPPKSDNVSYTMQSLNQMIESVKGKYIGR